MVKKLETQIKVGVDVGALWKAISKDMIHVVPKAAPNFIKEMEVIEGDGGLGTVISVHTGSDVPNMTYQKERIIELDENQLIIGLEAVEGGRLDQGFKSYAAFYKSSCVGESQTVVDFKVVYDAEMEYATFKEETMNFAAVFLKCLEIYLQKVSN